MIHERFPLKRPLNNSRFHRFGSEGMGLLGGIRRRFSAAPALWMRRVPRRLRHRLWYGIACSVSPVVGFVKDQTEKTGKKQEAACVAYIRFVHLSRCF